MGATLAGSTIPPHPSSWPCGSFHESPCDVSVSTCIQSRLAFSFSPIRLAPAVRCAPKNIEAAQSTRVQAEDLRMYKRHRLANLIGTKGVSASALSSMLMRLPFEEKGLRRTEQAAGDETDSEPEYRDSGSGVSRVSIQRAINMDLEHSVCGPVCVPITIPLDDGSNFTASCQSSCHANYIM